MQITHQAAQHLTLAATGLAHPPARPASRADVLEAIRRMEALQIDTIHVIARSPYLVLWSRLGDYDTAWLDQLLEEGAIFEYWAHALCFLPIEDYPYHRRLMVDRTRNWWWPEKWLDENPEPVERVLSHIREIGPARSADFTNEHQPSGGWWNWKDEKRALDFLHTRGDLMIRRREKFQRVYDLRQRVLPDWDDSRTPPYETVRRTLACKAVRALGILQAAWEPDFFRLPKRGVDKLMEELAAAGELIRVEVEGWKVPGYVHPDNRELLEQAIAGALQPSLTTLLSPFDPLIWDRKRVKFMFDFDYTIECYLPAQKRRYGYFSLPILHRGRFVGRLDPKAHRKEGIFEVKSLHLEPGVEPDEELAQALADSLRRAAAWHKTPQVVVQQSDPPEIREMLQPLLDE